MPCFVGGWLECGFGCNFLCGVEWRWKKEGEESKRVLSPHNVHTEFAGLFCNYVRSFQSDLLLIVIKVKWQQVK